MAVLQLLRISLVLYLVALMLHTLTGLEVTTCIVLAGLFVGLYTVAGGIDAVIWTDVVQTIVLASGSLICLALIVYALPGGLAQIFEIGFADQKFSLGSVVDGSLIPLSWGFDLGEKTGPLMLLMSVSFFLTEYTAAQHFVQRYCAARSLREARKSLLYSVAVAMISASIPASGPLNMTSSFRLTTMCLYRASKHQRCVRLARTHLTDDFEALKLARFTAPANVPSI